MARHNNTANETARKKLQRKAKKGQLIKTSKAQRGIDYPPSVEVVYLLKHEGQLIGTDRSIKLTDKIFLPDWSSPVRFIPCK